MVVTNLITSSNLGLSNVVSNESMIGDVIMSHAFISDRF